MVPLAEFTAMREQGGKAWNKLTQKVAYKQALDGGSIPPFTKISEYTDVCSYIANSAPNVVALYDNDMNATVGAVLQQMAGTNMSVEDAVAGLLKSDGGVASQRSEETSSRIEVKPTLSKVYMKLLDSYVDSGVFTDKIRELGLTDEIGTLIQKKYSDLSKEEYNKLLELRKTIPNPKSDTLIQKIIKKSDFEKYYLNKQGPTIGGCVAKASDVKNLDTYTEIRNGLRLDYDDISFPASGNEMYAIRFRTDDFSNLNIPDADYLMDKTGNISHPQTGTGFTSATDGSLIPEYDAASRMVPKRRSRDL